MSGLSRAWTSRQAERLDHRTHLEVILPRGLCVEICHFVRDCTKCSGIHLVCKKTASKCFRAAAADGKDEGVLELPELQEKNGTPTCEKVDFFHGI